MKQKDIILIVGVVILTGVVSYFLANLLIAPPKDRKEKVEVVEAISSDFEKPDSKYFNSGSIDPTQPITIGDNNNPKPFNKTNGQ
jgi:hypothetical protein